VLLLASSSAAQFGRLAAEPAVLEKQYMESSSIPLDLIQLVPFQGLVEQSVAGIYIIQDEHFQYANATFAGMGGYKPEELIGRRLKDFVPLDFADEVMDRYNKRITGEVPSMRFTTRGLHKNGDVVYIEVHGQAMEFRGRPAVVGVGVNVTDHVLRDSQLRRSQSEYRQLAAYLNTVREEQRAEYAREVHDVLGGILTSIKLDVGRISRRPDSPEVRAIAADLNSLVSEAIDSVREISESMRPQTLDHLGLGAAVATHLERFRERSGLRTTLTPPSFDVPLSRPRATAAFRIFQEALTNIARHAQASHVIVRFSSDRESFSLEIVDDGCGMELDATSSSRPVRHALGLMTMRERAHQVGGTLTIESAPGKGTRVLLHAPLTDYAFLLG
jgi:two-component system, NarL family, sensor histidine kinase UhpB